MHSVKRKDGWWITELPDGQECGPYATKAEAEEDRRGLKRTYDELIADGWDPATADNS